MKSYLQNSQTYPQPALQLFRDLLLEEDVPTKKHEDWKYTNLNFLADYKQTSGLPTASRYSRIAGRDSLQISDVTSADLIEDSQLPEGLQLSFINLYDESTWPQGVSDGDFSWKFANYFSDVLSAASPHCLVLEVTSAYQAEEPFLIDFQSTLRQHGGIYQPKLIVVCQPYTSFQAQLDIELKPSVLTNSEIDFVLLDGARAQVFVNEQGAGRGFFTSHSKLARDSFLDLVTLNSCPQWSRHNTNVELTGSGAEAHLQAAYLTKDKQFVDHHTTIDHQVPHTMSSQTYNGILTGASEAVFNGRVNILRDAQKSSSAQLNRNLLLDKKAKINTKPELQVDADDVSATHGATTGQLENSELFYLQSRGINEITAKKMICEGFAKDVGMNLSPTLRGAFLVNINKTLQYVIED